MTNEVVQNIIIIVTLIVLALRFFNGLPGTAPRHRIWTFGLCLLAWMFLYLRLSISRNYELIAPYDPLATLAWFLVLLSQGIALLYEWAPPALKRRFARRSP